jgi:predicted ATPase/transcriptional regulator with XRE-family HTH domain
MAPQPAARSARTGSATSFEGALSWPIVARALRQAAGCSQAGLAAQLGYHRATIQRWEGGSSVPDPVARQALSTWCQERGLFRTYSHGPLRGLTLTPALLSDLLTEQGAPATGARLQAVPTAPAPLHRAVEPSSLPLPLTRFVGRAPELATLTALLAQHRLVTLTGPGGTGKTRLALEVARTLAPGYPDGVFFVDLAPLADPALIPAAVAQALRVREQVGIPLQETLVATLRGRRALLVLDNYEHLLAGALVASALVQAGPGIVLLITSRAPLRLRGEREVVVPPLPLPAAADEPAALAENAAVTLFVSRAQDISANFTLTAENAPDVAALCRRLDGLPLAIELAAARTRLLPPAALLFGLTERLPTLAGGARDAPARQQTLWNAVAWSYDLLAPAEQRLIRRLAVCAGGATVELARAICDGEGEGDPHVEAGLSTLVENNLLTAATGHAGEPRVRMLETVRACALSYLADRGEATLVHRRLGDQLLRLVRQYAATGAWARLDGEIDNLRVVLGWCVEHGELAHGARLIWALGDYWIGHRGDDEFHAWRTRLLALPAAARPGQSRARLLVFTGFDAIWTTRERRAQAAADLEEVIAVSRDNGDRACLALGLRLLAFVRCCQGRYADAAPLAEEAVALWGAQMPHAEPLRARFTLLTALAAQGQFAEAEALVAETEVLAQEAHDEWPLLGAATLALLRRDWRRAQALWAETARVFAGMGELNPDRLVALELVAWAAFQQGDLPAALSACAACLALHARRGRAASVAAPLGTLALVAVRAGLLPAGARLLAFSATQRQAFGPADIFHRPEAEREAAVGVRAVLGEGAFAAAWATGAALSVDAALDLGLVVVAELQQVLAGTPTGATEGAVTTSE